MDYITFLDVLAPKASAFSAIRFQINSLYLRLSYGKARNISTSFTDNWFSI